MATVLIVAGAFALMHLSSRDEAPSGPSPLMQAAEAGNLERVRELVTRGLAVDDV
ncbi:MAG: hypothetical protein U5L11_04545 [Arhodomonas sp.]|nr:hypothetical protein [Arhodomonas sp.]